MCGIAGILSVNDVTVQALKGMTRAIRHRGPDDEGYALFAGDRVWIGGGDDTPEQVFASSLSYTPDAILDDTGYEGAVLALAHRRLSILDLSPAGHQPMSYRDRYWIVYNGEIYNHQALRNELEQAGHRFVSQADTEVVLAAYAQWGEGCLERLNGMFAFALYDRQERCLFLARDRFGVKPLYYWHTPHGSLAFGSEIKQFEELPGWQPVLSRQRGYDYLVFGLTDHSDDTLFEGVRQLPPGHCVTLDCSIPWRGKLPVSPWYRLTPKRYDGDYATAVERFGGLLSDAVCLRTRADVPVGSCLSGGLDSSSIVCLVSRLLQETMPVAGQQQTFSACSSISRYDERRWIMPVVAATGVDAKYVFPEADGLFDALPRITRMQDEPFGSTSIYAQWKVFELAASHHVKVMLDGQGSDEQLAGYHGFFAPYLATLWRERRWRQLYDEARAMKRLHGYGYATTAKRLASCLLTGPFGSLMRRRWGSELAPEWLDLKRLSAATVNPVLSDSGVPDSSLLQMSLRQLTSSNLQMLLHWEDRNSMAHSVESRVPFLDYRLVEFVVGLPDDFKIHDAVTKRVLRDAMRGVVPEEVRTRVDKLGFVTPEEIWLRETVPQRFRSELARAVEVSSGLLRAEATFDMLDAMIAGKRRFSFVPWRLISFGQWVETFGVRI